MNYYKRMAWLMRHGFKLQRAGMSWVCRFHGEVVNIGHKKREVVRDSFREFALGVSA